MNEVVKLREGFPFHPEFDEHILHNVLRCFHRFREAVYILRQWLVVCPEQFRESIRVSERNLFQ